MNLNSILPKIIKMLVCIFRIWIPSFDLPRNFVKTFREVVSALKGVLDINQEDLNFSKEI